MKLKDYLKEAWERQYNLDPNRLQPSTLEWLCDQGILNNYDWLEINGGVFRRSDTAACERCDERFDAADNDLEAVVISRRNFTRALWCCGCREDASFYCERSNEYYCSNTFTCTQVDHDYICHEVYEDELYYWDSDGRYHWDEEPTNENPRCGYHHGDRSHWETRSPFDLFGVELEIKADSEYDLDSLCDRARDLGLLAEEDASLDEDLGVEIVGPPMALRDYRNGRWAKFIKFAQGKAEGWDAGTGYGIHISFRRSSLGSILKQAKFLRFFHANRRFCEKIAGRPGTSYCSYDSGVTTWSRHLDTPKYCAAAIRQRDRIEVRIFRSTLKFSSFLKNVQFIAALVDFVRHCGAQDIQGHARFCEFVNHPSRRNQYRELVAFLDQKGLNNAEAQVS